MCGPDAGGRIAGDRGTAALGREKLSSAPVCNRQAHHAREADFRYLGGHITDRERKTVCGGIYSVTALNDGRAIVDVELIEAS